MNMQKLIPGLVSSLICLVLTACGSSEPFERSVGDGVNDAFGTGDGINWDLHRVAMTTTEDELILGLRFAQEVRLHSGEGNVSDQDLVGYILFDSDQNAATPADQAVTEQELLLSCPGVLALGPEYYLDLYIPNPDGSYPIFEFGNDYAETGEARVDVSGSDITLYVALPSLNNSAALFLGLELGNGSEPTDCAPDDGRLSNVADE